MVRKICLDSDALIEIMHETEKGLAATDALQNAKVFTTAVNIFELFSRKSNVKDIEKELDCLDTVDFEKDDALVAAELRKKLSDKGRMIDFRDIFIAAMVKNRNSELLTFNRKHFEKIPGLKLVKI